MATDTNNTGLRSAVRALLDARDAGMITENEWEALALALDPPPALGTDAAERFTYDPDHGLTRTVTAGGGVVLRQTALPDCLWGVAEFAQSRPRGFVVESARADLGFEYGRAEVEAACAFLVHLGLAVRTPTGDFTPNGEGIAERALSALNGLEAQGGAGA